MDKLKKTRILGAIGLVSLFLGVMLPYYEFSLLSYSYKIRLWGYFEGKIVMILLIANLLFIFKDLILKYVPQMFNSDIGQKIKNANEKFAIVPTILIVIFVVVLFLRLDVGSTLEHGLGFYFLWLGIICLLLHTFIIKKNTNVLQVKKEEYRNVTIMDNNIKYCPYCKKECSAIISNCPNCGHQF